MYAERLHIDLIEFSHEAQGTIVEATDGPHRRGMVIPDVYVQVDRGLARRIYEVFSHTVIEEATRKAASEAGHAVREGMAFPYALDIELQAQEAANRTAAEVQRRIVEGQRRMMAARNRMRVHQRYTEQMRVHGYDLGWNPQPISELAEAKADRTLREFLSPEQQNTWDRCRFIVVCGGTTNSVYVIVGKPHTNIYRHEGDKIFRSLCFVPRKNVPLGDVILLQKLALEANETEAILTANDFGTSPHHYQNLKERWKLKLSDLPDKPRRLKIPNFKDLIKGRLA